MTNYVRSETRARSSRALIQVLDTCHPESEFVPEDECRWMTLCTKHGELCTHPTLALARSHAAAPEGWCQGCRNGEPDVSDQED